MSKIHFFVFIIVFCLTVGGTALTVGAEGNPAAEEIVAKADNLMRGTSSFAEIEMKLERKKSYQNRTIKMKAWTKGNEKSFIVIMEPAKDAGTTFLKLKSEMWNYLPKIERKVKIPPSMMLQSWMGSDFTNDDVSRADSMITDYTHKLIGEETIEGQPCWKIESIPKENAPVFWGKVVNIIQKDGYIYRKQEFYDEDMALAKVMVLSRIRETSGRRVPTLMTMTNEKKPGNITTLSFDKIEFDITIAEDTFTQQNLIRGGR